MSHAQFSSEKIRDLGQTLLYRVRERANSFEDAAQLATEQIFNHFGKIDGRQPFALVRIFRITHYEHLPAELQPLADPQYENWLALMGTTGVEPAWCDRHQSQSHKLLPTQGDLTPMLQAAFEQIGLLEQPVPESNDFLQGTAVMNRYFHVQEAPGSSYVPAQSEFVEPYGIQSVIGLGTRFLSTSAYFMIAFSTVPVDTDAARALIGFSPFLSTLLAHYDGTGVIFS